MFLHSAQYWYKNNAIRIDTIIIISVFWYPNSWRNNSFFKIIHINHSEWRDSKSILYIILYKNIYTNELSWRWLTFCTLNYLPSTLAMSNSPCIFKIGAVGANKLQRIIWSLSHFQYFLKISSCGTSTSVATVFMSAGVICSSVQYDQPSVLLQ